MTGRIFTADHHVYDLPPLLSWNVRHTGTVPCDSWSVTAVYQPEMLTVLRMAAGFAAIENGMTQLRGIVDEYTVELGSRGMTVTLSGRGYAARLLDNESRPVTYEQVTLRELIRCHAEPYGISCGAAADLRSTVPYTAGVGISQWKAAMGAGGTAISRRRPVRCPGLPKPESCWQHRNRTAERESSLTAAVRC